MTNRMKRESIYSQRYCNGFTLIELIVVIIIIASICALALPNSAKILENIKIRSTVRQICALLNYARWQAVISGTNYKVNYNFREKDLLDN